MEKWRERSSWQQPCYGSGSSEDISARLANGSRVRWPSERQQGARQGGQRHCLQPGAWPGSRVSMHRRMLTLTRAWQSGGRWVLLLMVVDNSDFPPPHLTGPSDYPYDRETAPATSFKQRGFVWPFLCCSSSSSSSSLWHCFGVLAGSLSRLPPQEEVPSIPTSTVCSSPALQTT